MNGIKASVSAVIAANFSARTEGIFSVGEVIDSGALSSLVAVGESW
jgi:hypothetical protein